MWSYTDTKNFSTSYSTNTTTTTRNNNNNNDNNEQPYGLTDTYLHLASSAPLLSPAPAAVAPVYALYSSASHPFSPAASVHAPGESKIQGSIREAKQVYAFACVKKDKKVYLTLLSGVRIQPNAAAHSKEKCWRARIFSFGKSAEKKNEERECTKRGKSSNP